MNNLSPNMHKNANLQNENFKYTAEPKNMKDGNIPKLLSAHPTNKKKEAEFKIKFCSV